MAHSLSAKKRIRQNIKRRMRNRARKSALHTQIRRFEESARRGSDISAVENEFRLAQKRLDKIAVQGTLHRNTTARRKSRLARQLNAARARLT